MKKFKKILVCNISDLCGISSHFTPAPLDGNVNILLSLIYTH